MGHGDMGIYLLNKAAMGYSRLATRLQTAGWPPVQRAYTITALPKPPWRNMVILTDWQQLDLTEREVLLAATYPHPTIMMVITSSHFSCQDARRIMRSGRCDLVNAPASDEALEMAVWNAVARSRLVQEQLAAHDKAVHCLAKLTRREKQILGALATGASNKMAARQLGLSPRTVEVHRANMVRRSGMAHVADLVQAHLAIEQYRSIAAQRKPGIGA